MKRLTGVFLIVAMGVAAGCSSGIAVQSAYDPGYDRFADLKTFKLMTPADDPEFPQWALEHAQYMAGKLLSRLKYVEADSADTADFLVNVHGSKSSFVDSTDYGYQVDKWSVSARSWDREKYEWLITEGSITLDIVAAETNRLIWRASADSEYLASMSRGQIEQKIEQSVAKMLKQFPPQTK